MSLHERIKVNYFRLWKIRAIIKEHPEWIEQPPLSLIHCPLEVDLWPKVVDHETGRLLLTEGDLGVGPHEYYGDETYEIDDLERGTSYATLWYWNWEEADNEITEIDVSFPYYRDDLQQGSQKLSLYNPNDPKANLTRSVFISEYAETGYEGHHRKHDTATAADRAFFVWLLEVIEEACDQVQVLEKVEEDLPLEHE